MRSRQLLSDADIAALIESELAKVPSEVREFYDRFRITPTRMPFAKPTTLESAFVVARRGDEAIYYEEIEGGFNTSAIDSAGRIIDHWFGQESLRAALWPWMSETLESPPH